MSHYLVPKRSIQLVDWWMSVGLLVSDTWHKVGGWTAYVNV
jgi:hypothetical protein